MTDVAGFCSGPLCGVGRDALLHQQRLCGCAACLLFLGWLFLNELDGWKFGAGMWLALVLLHMLPSAFWWYTASRDPPSKALDSVCLVMNVVLAALWLHLGTMRFLFGSVGLLDGDIAALPLVLAALAVVLVGVAHVCGPRSSVAGAHAARRQ